MFLTPRPSRPADLEGKGVRLLLGDDLGHRAVVAEGPVVANGHVAGSSGRLDLPPGAVRRKADHGIPGTGSDATALAGRV